MIHYQSFPLNEIIFKNDDKRQFTLSVIMDALGRIVNPTQVIWAGETGQTDIRDRIPKEHRHDEYLRHEQSKSHWTVLETLKRQVLMLAAHVKNVCEAEGLEFATTYWILIMDCYSFHIKEEFLDWYQAEFGGYLIILFIPANSVHCVVATSGCVTKLRAEAHLKNLCSKLVSCY